MKKGVSPIDLKQIPKLIAKILFFVCSLILILSLMCVQQLPQTLWVTKAEDVVLPTKIPLVAKTEPLRSAVGATPQDSYQASVRLFGLVPIASAKVKIAKENYVIPGGSPFGIKMMAEGVLVVGFQDVPTAEGNQNPAKQAGLKEGDLLLAIDGKTLSTNAALQNVVAHSKGKSLSLTVRRNQTALTLTLKPVPDETGTLRAGIWVRDSTAGLGTLTFYHPDSGMYGGLGHGVCDSDTGNLMSLLTGQIVKAQVTGIERATAGTAGELQGTLIDNWQMGSILTNSPFGVYGRLTGELPAAEAVRVAPKQEVTPGDATLLCCVTGQVRSYTCRIEKVNLNDASSQNLVVRITDAALLDLTGGIVQGMSGSPILQNGCLVGAITHVFVNTPQKGYGIFAETMLSVAQNTAATEKNMAS